MKTELNETIIHSLTRNKNLSKLVRDMMGEERIENLNFDNRDDIFDVFQVIESRLSSFENLLDSLDSSTNRLRKNKN